MLSLEYIAGLIDSDGSISISLSKNRYKRKDSVGDETVSFAFIVNFRQVNQYKFILEEIQETLGIGKIYNHTNANGQPMSSWQTTKELEALEICRILLPYLRIKKDQAELMIEALTIWQSGRLGRKGAGYYHTEESKKEVIRISNLMNPSQQKETSRRNKEIRENIDGLGPGPLTGYGPIGRELTL